MGSLQRDINYLFEGLWDDFPTVNWSSDQTSFMPRVDMKETEDEFEVHTELPGVSKDEIELSIRDNALLISGEKRVTRSEEKEGWHRTERSFGRFSRTLPFPSEVDEERISAKFENGVLTINVAKADDEVRTSRRINIS